MEGADGTSINTNPLIYTCEVGMRREDDIIRKMRQQQEGGGGGRKKNCKIM